MPTSSSTAEAPAAVAAQPASRRSRRPSPEILAVVGFWLATRAALVVFTVMACWLLRGDGGGRLSGPTRWVPQRVTRGGSFHFLPIADRGSLALPVGGGDQAFFPGYPLAVAAVRPLAGGNAAMAG